MQLGTFYQHEDYEQVSLFPKIAYLYHWSVSPKRAIHNFHTIGSKTECLNQNWTKFINSITICNHFTMFAERN